MSIRVLIQDKVHRGMLFPLVPRAPGMTARRAMFVSEGLWDVLNSPVGDLEWEQRVAELQADLEYFVEGHPIDPKYLFLLYPASDCVWEIRSVRDEPSIRVLGLFAVKDVFIATHHALRSDLGGWQSREWKRVKRAARSAWAILFHTYRPLPGVNIRALVTGALDGKYFKTPNS